MFREAAPKSGGRDKRGGGLESVSGVNCQGQCPRIPRVFSLKGPSYDDPKAPPSGWMVKTTTTVSKQGARGTGARGGKIGGGGEREGERQTGLPDRSANRCILCKFLIHTQKYCDTSSSLSSKHVYKYKGGWQRTFPSPSLELGIPRDTFRYRVFFYAPTS